ncbi:MAG: hypothetical protein ACRC7G_00350, partial [Beijerinckiaceae bacterium]
MKRRKGEGDSRNQCQRHADGAAHELKPVMRRILERCTHGIGELRQRVDDVIRARCERQDRSIRLRQAAGLSRITNSAEFMTRPTDLPFGKGLARLWLQSRTKPEVHPMSLTRRSLLGTAAGGAAALSMGMRPS